MQRDTSIMNSVFFLGFTLTGLILVLWILADTFFKLIHGIRAHFLSEAVPLTVKFGTWAVVTGSTDGIGKAYALALASRGINVVLISRCEKKLAAVAEEITLRHLVSVKTITADFSKGKEVYEKIKKELKDVPVGILVNNVGRQYKYPMEVGKVDEQELWDIVNINVGATVMMTRITLPQMVERRKGAIVNVSSGSEHTPLPFMTVYAASKVFIKSFSEALRYEYRKYGITVQHLSPMFVNTKMNDFSKRLRETKIFVPDAETYAKNAVNVLGILDSSSGYWAHGLQTFFTKISPIWIRIRMGAIMNHIFIEDYYRNTIKNLKDVTDKITEDKKAI